MCRADVMQEMSAWQVRVLEHMWVCSLWKPLYETNNGGLLFQRLQMRAKGHDNLSWTVAGSNTNPSTVVTLGQSSQRTSKTVIGCHHDQKLKCIIILHLARGMPDIHVLPSMHSLVPCDLPHPSLEFGGGGGGALGHCAL